MDAQWPAITSETLPWHSDADDLEAIPKSRRRKIGSTYQAAIPLHIAELPLEVPTALAARVEALIGELSRFDALQAKRGYDLPALLLRSESAASSQIENLTSSVRNVALAEVSDDGPQNALLIRGNLEAMKTALALDGELGVDAILEIHRILINRGGMTFGGQLRDQQVWVGGTAYSPHGALYVPPTCERVPDLLDDLVAFSRREDIGPVAKAAIVHAQLETIHPFIDGNGRTGRTLLHKILKDEGVLQQAAVPVSAGLLHDINGYMASLEAYQQGDPIAVIEQLVDALELALAIGSKAASQIDEVMAGWDDVITERAGSSIRRLPRLLAEQPVVNSGYIAKGLSITTRAATNLIARACEYGILRPMGNRRRGEFYQADAIIDILEEISSDAGIRRMFG